MCLTDDSPNPRQQPTRANILDAMHWLVTKACPHDSLFFHCMLFVPVACSYGAHVVALDSGHGSQVKDTNGDEIDGYDEVIFPVDYKRNGHITDDVRCVFT